MKECVRCHQSLAEPEFAPHRHFTDGLNPRCRSCVKEAALRLRDPGKAVSDPGTKFCTKCLEIKPKSEFYRNSRAKDGLQWTCRPCTNAVNDHWAKTHEHDAKRIASGAARRAHVKRKYGLSREEYERRVDEAGGLCEVCKQPERQTRGTDGKVWELCVDHDHMTGEVRGLLCHDCNSAIARCRDDSARLRALADYLDRYYERT